MSRIAEYISSETKRIGIAGHVRPDGDCIGSTLGMAGYIRSYFEAQVDVYIEPIPDMFKFLHGADTIIHEVTDKRMHYDLFIALDCAEPNRLGKAKELFDRAERTICIDHHQSNIGYADVNDIRPHDSSTCEIIASWMDHDRITKEIAECIYCGMVTDTGVFQYACTHSSTMELAGELMNKGIDYPWIVNRIFFEKSIEQQRILGIALTKAKLVHDGEIIYTVLSDEDMKAADAKVKHLEGIAASLRATKGVKVAIFLQQNHGNYKLSLRSDGSCDVAEVCGLYGGGGHDRAAGATINKTPEVFLPELIAAIEERLD